MLQQKFSKCMKSVLVLSESKFNTRCHILPVNLCKVPFFNSFNRNEIVIDYNLDRRKLGEVNLIFLQSVLT
jgi:hypothetical protein